MPTLYLIHFTQPYRAKSGKKQKTAQHYLGYTINIENRMALHRSGQGAKLLRVCKQEGITWEIARVWPGEGRETEKKFKRRGHFKTICPCCNQKVSHLRHKPNRHGIEIEIAEA